MTTPSAFTAMRREVAVVVDAAQKAERKGNRAEARALYERSMRMLARDEGEYVPTLIRRIAVSYIDDGMFDAALDCLAAAQHLSRARGDTSGVAHALNQMGGANLQRGDLEQSVGVLPRRDAAEQHDAAVRIDLRA